MTPHVVRQRLRLAAVSPKLMQVYRDGGLTLEQLMAFAITEDHARQEAVYERLSYDRDASTIRRLLTETHVAATDRRAVFVGVEAYTEAGGTILRDLFTEDRGGRRRRVDGRAGIVCAVPALSWNHRKFSAARRLGARHLHAPKLSTGFIFDNEWNGRSLGSGRSYRGTRSA